MYRANASYGSEASMYQNMAGSDMGDDHEEQYYGPVRSLDWGRLGKGRAKRSLPHGGCS
ncbi:hypothetical protein NXC14_PA00407 (plasmid) [Rhizobium sp. NXC14]|nr:hypothetical protein NXC14_PA00407 [Rhizobium sp. NXC14]